MASIEGEGNAWRPASPIIPESWARDLSGGFLAAAHAGPGLLDVLVTGKSGLAGYSARDLGAWAPIAFP